MPIDVSDLLGRRWEPRRDCRWVVLEAMRRAGIDAPDWALGADRPPEWARGLVDWSSLERAWERLRGVRPDLREGDVVLSEAPSEDDGGRSYRWHVSAIVDPRRRLAVTSSRDLGVSVHRVRDIDRIEGIYRYRDKPGAHPDPAGP